ncbi:hypothetical protein [Streptomyces mirabilis]|uniref:hypothetical protein n=1 Tax=Streptomyces mirabilis TaxID=68239 RepID=UPI0036A7A978
MSAVDRDIEILTLRHQLAAVAQAAGTEAWAGIRQRVARLLGGATSKPGPLGRARAAVAEVTAE